MDKAIQIAYNEHFELKCELASNVGFKCISVNFHDMQDRSDKAWKEAPEKILKILERYGLKCIQTHLPYYDLRVSAEILEDEMESAIKESIRVGGEIGAAWNVYHPRSAINMGFTAAKAFEINRSVISKYIEYAIKYGTGIALENLPIFQIVPVMPFYTSDYNDLCELMESFESEAVGICWDTGHAHLMHFDQADAIKYLGSRIKCTHIHNTYRNDDYHLPPDLGTIDWKSVMGAFKVIDYDGPLTLETHCSYHDKELLRSFARHNLEGLNYLERLYSNFRKEEDRP